MKHHLTTKLAAALAASLALATPAVAADLELTAGVLGYFAAPSPSAANRVTITLAAGTYAIDDPAETITLGTAALAAGCAPLDADTVTCPAAAITSFSIVTRLGDDRIVLTGIAHPAVVTGGDGNDTVIGGNAADTIVWSPGDDNDTVDGGPGEDVVQFNGSNAAESYVIVRDGAGFALHRNVAAVTLNAQRIETLRLATLGGADVVSTQPLAATRQEIADAGTDAVADLLTLDAAGDCYFVRGSELQVVGYEPVQYAGFEGIGGTNVVCGGTIDVVGATLTYVASPLAVNALEVTRDDDVYLLHDAGEPVLSPSPEAFAAGCTRVDATTAACPAPTVALFDVRLADGDDAADLTGLDAPATVRGGIGGDIIIGGDADDTFIWFPGDGNDTIDGGLGTDTVDFLGSGLDEIFAIAPAGTGFTVARNIGAYTLQATDVEVLALDGQAGTNTVTTTVLARTRQELRGVDDGLPDSLMIDARGLCLERAADQVTAPGREPVVFADFATVVLTNEFCAFDPCIGAVASTGCTVNGAKNQPCQGTDGNDVIAGTPGADVILGGGGRDRIKGGDGGDVICGEAGDDVLLGGADDDYVVGGPGADRLRGDAGNDHVLGGENDDRLDGGKGDDELHGGLGADRLKGAAGTDLLRGDDGLDGMDGGPGDDVCVDTDQAGPFRRCEL